MSNHKNAGKNDNSKTDDKSLKNLGSSNIWEVIN